MAKTAYDKARESALRILDHGDNSSKELAAKLLKKRFSSNTVSQVISDLEQAGLIDDLRFAENYTMSGMEKGRGPVWIKNKLTEKGVDASIADTVFEKLSVYEKELELCMEEAFSLCGMEGCFEADSSGDYYPVEGSLYADRKADYFSWKTDPGEKDRNIIRKKQAIEKNKLMRRLMNAGFTMTSASKAVRIIEKL